MNRIAMALAALCLATTACKGTGPGAGQGVPDPRPGVEADVEETVSVYAAVIRQLVTRDHTYGDDPKFRVVYVLDGVVANAEDPLRSTNDRQPAAPFDRRVKEGLRRALTDLPSVRFVKEPDSVIAGEEPGHVINHGVLLTLGPIRGGPRKVTVGNELWINGLAGQWLTYVVERRARQWRVTGTKGPVAIS